MMSCLRIKHLHKVGMAAISATVLTVLALSPHLARATNGVNGDVDSLLATAPASARKLNPPLPLGGGVYTFEVSSDGRFVVYEADQHTDEVAELFSVPVAGGPPVRLNLPLPPGGDVDYFRISPDSSRVVYIADQGNDEVFELFSVPINGPASASVPLNPALVAGGDMDAFQISPDSSRVIYRADQRSDEVFELFSVPINGPANAGVPLNPALVAGGDVGSFRISLDSSRVVYRADQRADDVLELFGVPINGPASANVQLNPPLVAGRKVDEFGISPDGSRVVYTSDQVSAGILELFSVPINGPANASVRLHRSVTQPRGVDHFQISPDSKRVVYISNQRTADALELFSAPIDGPASASVQLSLDLSKGLEVDSFQISPDSSRVVYRADWRADELYELISVPISGPVSASVGLNPALPPGGDVHSYQISPDSRSVIYSADQRTDEVTELFSAPLNGGALVPLNGPLVANGDAYGFRISPDSRSVIYNADQHTNEAFELFSVPINGPASTGIKRSAPLTAGRRIAYFEIIPDRNWVVYTADQETDETFELYVADDGQQQVGFAAASAQVDEAGGSARFVLTLSQPAVLTVTVQYAVTGGTASPGADYIVAAGTLSIAPGETSPTLDVPITNDALAEPAETLLISLSNPTNATLGSATSVTLTIIDDDAPGTPAPPPPLPPSPGDQRVHLPLVVR